MRTRPRCEGALALVLLSLLGACKSESPTPTDGGASGREDAGDAPRPPAVAAIRCSEDELAANVVPPGSAPLEITFNAGANPTQYTNRCATVRVGSSVAFSGSFLQHPLEAAGGDTPSPIPYTAEEPPGQRLVVTFPNPGTYGFQCEFHPTSMFGAIRVVP